MCNRIAIVQPMVPSYRTEFFRELDKNILTDVYVFEKQEVSAKQGFLIEDGSALYLKNLSWKGIILYSISPLLSKKYDTLVLMLHFAHITTWLLLLTKWLHRKKIILWGQGISVKRYLKEERKPDRKLKWQIALADGVWTYMEKECVQWKSIFPQKPIVALNNTLSGVEEMVRTAELDVNPNPNVNLNPNVNENENKKVYSLQEIKEKWGITEDVVLIFCARFENNYRRVDLLVGAIERLDPQKYGFIIIGEGKNKPDFTKYKNVHDFGAVYDNEIKRELFAAADIYFQPGWVGLSIVEAMAYGKPIFTFKRSEETLQCVEYDYIKDGWNGLIFDDMNAFNAKVNNLSKEEIERMGSNANHFVRENLTIDKMVQNALSIL